MRLLGIDFESTGLDPLSDRITEIGAALWDVETQRPLTTIGVFCHDETYPEFSKETLEMMGRVCGITLPILKEFGTSAKANLQWLDHFCSKHKVDYLVAHNAFNYDKPLLMSELSRHGIDAPCLRSLPWLDTRTDIPFATEPDSRKLKHLAGDHGFLNPFAHRAVFDVLTMLRVLSHYDINEVLAYQKIPFMVVRAMVSFDQKDLAKARRYSWEKIGEKTYTKMWVKLVKQNKCDEEIAECKKAGFQSAIIAKG